MRVIQNMLKIMKGQLRNDSDYVYIRHYMKKYKYVPVADAIYVLTLDSYRKYMAERKAGYGNRFVRILERLRSKR